MSLPAADDLFRPTAPAAQQDQASADDEPAGPGGSRRPSGRVRHDEKMTVYVTADELIELEHLRLRLRR